jgi:hypothetical protein
MRRGRTRRPEAPQTPKGTVPTGGSTGLDRARRRLRCHRATLIREVDGIDGTHDDASSPATAAGSPSRRKPEQSRSIWLMPSGATSTNATCSTISGTWFLRRMRKRQLRRWRSPTISWRISRTVKSDPAANQPSMRCAISSRPERTSGPRGKSILACADGARHAARRPKSRNERAARNASGMDLSFMGPNVRSAQSIEHRPFG